ncbi:hypothetical protein D3C81_2307530 [compost metagenome]
MEVLPGLREPPISSGFEPRVKVCPAMAASGLASSPGLKVMPRRRSTPRKLM